MTIRSAAAIAALVSVALAGPAAAQSTPTRFTHADMIATKRLGTVVPSPDGRQAIIQVLTYTYEHPGPDGDLWIVDVDATSAPRRLTSGPGVESSPTWSPDGRTIVFVARAGDGPSQLFRVTPSGGAPVPITTLSTGASQPRFSPDGRTIAFLSNVYPDADGDAANAARLKAARENPSSARIYTGFPYRDYGNNWFDGRVNHLMTVSPEGGAVRALLTGTPLVAEPGWSGVMEFDWRPDGGAIVFSGSIDFHKQADRFDTKDIYLVELGSGRGPSAPGLLVDAQTNDRHPVFSPDGRYLAWHAVWCCWGETDAGGVDGVPQAQLPAGYPMKFDQRQSYRDNRILVRDMQTGVVTVLMQGWDRPPEAPSWSADGRELFFAAPDEGHNRLFRIALADALKGSAPAVLADMPGSWGRPLVAGTTVLAAHQRTTRPPELFAIETQPASAAPRAVTDLNGELLRPFTMNEAEELFWTHEGRRIQGWIVKPPGFDPSKRYPLFLFPHGGPFGVHVDGFHYRWNAQIFAASGYVVFMPNPTGSTGFGERFAADVQGAWGGRVFDEVMAGVDHLLATSPWLDGDRMVAGSASYGGYFMNWLITQTDRFKAVFTHASVWNFVSMTGASIISHYMLADASHRSPWEDFAAFNRYSPHYHAGNIRTPTYVSHGGQDAGVPDGQGMELYWTLQRLGVESRFIYFPDEGHHILKPANSRVFYQEMLDWFAAHLEERLKVGG
ncbi:MAG: S9 family peptidase [Acidobacteria bacterium]|nr:S9 family peptidase [Acidobacteriota bacterium]